MADMEAAEAKKITADTKIDLTNFGRLMAVWDRIPVSGRNVQMVPPEVMSTTIDMLITSEGAKTWMSGADMTKCYRTYADAQVIDTQRLPNFTKCLSKAQNGEASNPPR